MIFYVELVRRTGAPFAYKPRAEVSSSLKFDLKLHEYVKTPGDAGNAGVQAHQSFNQTRDT